MSRLALGVALVLTTALNGPLVMIITKVIKSKHVAHNPPIVIDNRHAKFPARPGQRE